MDALGRPNEGIHTHVLGIAVFDLALTALAARYLAPSAFVVTFGLLLLAGIVVHRVVGVRTTLTNAFYQT